MFSSTAMLTADIFQKTIGEIFASHIHCKRTLLARHKTQAGASSYEMLSETDRD